MSLKLIARLLSAALLVLVASSYGADRFHGSICAKDKNSKECAMAKDWMRKNHPHVLIHGRDMTVRQGVRARNDAEDPLYSSLRGCVSCHVRKDKETGEYPKITSKDHWCAGCHQYMAVNIDCFECHSSKPDAQTIERLGLDR